MSIQELTIDVDESVGEVVHVSAPHADLKRADDSGFFTRDRMQSAQLNDQWGAFAAATHNC